MRLTREQASSAFTSFFSATISMTCSHTSIGVVGAADTFFMADYFDLTDDQRRKLWKCCESRVRDERATDWSRAWNSMTGDCKEVLN